MSNHSKVRIHSGLTKTMYEGITVSEIKDRTIEVPTSYIQEYDCAFAPMAELKPSSAMLLRYLVTQMTTTNEVTFIKKEKEEYMEFLRSNNINASTSMASINNALNELKRSDFIRPIHRGCYYVNPLYFTKGVSKNKRLEMVKTEYNRLFLQDPESFDCPI